MLYVTLEDLSGARPIAGNESAVRSDLNQVASVLQALLSPPKAELQNGLSKAAEEFMQAFAEAKTARELLQSPFLASVGPSVPNTHIQNLKSSKISCKLHEALLTAAYTIILDNQAKQALMLSFLAADKAHRGVLLPEDTQGIGISLPIFKRLNLSSTGTISFHEFCVAAMSKEVLTDGNVKKLFRILDIYEKGFLTLDDFERWFGSKKYPWDSVIKEAL